MSKQRMVRDSFWTDSYIERLTPDEKLLFLYLLTNPLSNVAGIYEIRAKRIGFETGYDVEVVENILQRFQRDGKILRHEDWIVIINHIKNQSLNPSIIQGCQRIFNELPPDIHRVVTGWVQAGLLNLTLLNLTLLNSTLPNGPSEEPITKERKETIENEFDTFWQAYPKKVGKGAAEKAWQKMKPNLATVLTAVEGQKSSEQWSKDSGKFIPHPTTWINQRRWEDEVVVTRLNVSKSKYD